MFKKSLKILFFGYFLISFSVHCEAVGLGSWTYKYEVDRENPLCHALLQRLNKYAKDERPNYSCGWEAISTHPKFSELPWEILDATKHKELVFKLEKYFQEGPEGYFETLPGLQHLQPDSAYRLRAKDFIEHGGKLRIWRTKPAFLYGSNIDSKINNKDEQVILQMQPLPGPTEDKSCTGTLHSGWNALSAVVLPDLSGPDPSIDPGAFAILSGGSLFSYNGKPVIISHEEVWKVSDKNILSGECDFEYAKGK